MPQSAIPEARNLLTRPWTCDDLLRFFGNRPVAEWFNRGAPRIKSGEVKPETLDAVEALSLLLTDPLLIRRPLIEANGRREVGFDLALVDDWLGLPAWAMDMAGDRDSESCVNGVNASPWQMLPPRSKRQLDVQFPLPHRLD